MDRAQLSFDFLVGMGVFMIAFGFVVGFLPGMFEPFTGNAGEDMVVADRAAARLADDLLTTGRAHELDPACTEGFFNDSGDPGCPFETTGGDRHAALGIDDVGGLNVTIESDAGIASVDGQPLAAGPAPGGTADTVVARRLVTLDGTAHRLFVRVW